MINRYLCCLLVGVLFASVSQILLKKSAMRTYSSFFREYINPWVIGGYGLMFGSMVINIIGYSGVEYKNGPVIEALGNVFVPALSFLVFKEKLSLRKTAGICMIMLGIFVFYA